VRCSVVSSVVPADHPRKVGGGAVPAFCFCFLGYGLTLQIGLTGGAELGVAQGILLRSSSPQEHGLLEQKGMCCM
jgi:hypothetical protein